MPFYQCISYIPYGSYIPFAFYSMYFICLMGHNYIPFALCLVVNVFLICLMGHISHLPVCLIVNVFPVGLMGHIFHSPFIQCISYMSHGSLSHLHYAFCRCISYAPWAIVLLVLKHYPIDTTLQKSYAPFILCHIGPCTIVPKVVPYVPLVVHTFFVIC